MDNKTVVLDMVDSDRMKKLEEALEYAINRVDGLSYALDAVPLLTDETINRARLLLPHVRWHWVVRRN